MSFLRSLDPALTDREALQLIGLVLFVGLITMALGWLIPWFQDVLYYRSHPSRKEPHA
jgi:hypothetical protein